MPRSPRIEYEGAVYHVMCRGDHREPIFKDEKDRYLFLETLGQVCERAGWVIHSYVLMNNHYHFLLETPEGGLVDGMRWFQTTYTARFNARHRLCGHLFQGRYKAIVVDSAEAEYFRMVSDYIHLNPARAQCLKAAPYQLEEFVWSSYPAFIGKANPPPWLEVDRVLASHGIGAKAYRRYMQERVKEVLEDKDALDEHWRAIRRGWYLGGEAFRDELLDRIGDRIAKRRRESYSGEGVKKHDEKMAYGLLQRGLEQLKVEKVGVQSWKTTDIRKQALVWLIRSSSMVSSEWICEQLGMGHRSNISRAMRRMETFVDRDILKLKKKMLRCKD